MTSNAPRRNEHEPGAHRFRSRERAQDRRVAYGRERKLIQLDRAALRDGVCDDREQRVEIERYGDSGRRAHV